MCEWPLPYRANLNYFELFLGLGPICTYLDLFVPILRTWTNADMVAEFCGESYQCKWGPLELLFYMFYIFSWGLWSCFWVFLYALASLESMLECQCWVMFVQMYVHSMFTVSLEYVHSMFTVCSQYVQSMFRVCSEYVQSMFRVCSEYVLSMFRL